MGVCTIDLEADSITDIVKGRSSKVYKNIYFISKGIGTEVAGVDSHRLGKDADLYLENSQDIIKTVEILGEMIRVYIRFFKE